MGAGRGPKKKEQKKHQVQTKLKEVKFRVNVGDHDSWFTSTPWYFEGCGDPRSGGRLPPGAAAVT